MIETITQIIEKLEHTHSLTVEEYELLLEHRSDETAAILAEKADAVRRQIYGNTVFIRGLIRTRERDEQTPDNQPEKPDAETAQRVYYHEKKEG